MIISSSYHHDNHDDDDDDDDDDDHHDDDDDDDDGNQRYLLLYCLPGIGVGAAGLLSLRLVNQVNRRNFSIFIQSSTLCNLIEPQSWRGFVFFYSGQLSQKL